MSQLEKKIMKAYNFEGLEPLQNRVDILCTLGDGGDSIIGILSEIKLKMQK